MKKMTQDQGWKKTAQLQRDLVAARMRKDEVAVTDLERALERLADDDT